MDKILDNKPKILNKRDGIEILDFNEPSYVVGIEDIIIEDFGYVTEKMVMRPDLFASVYGEDVDSFGEILKFNRISNPFTLNEGEILAIPKREGMESFFISNSRRSTMNAKFEGSKEDIRKKVKDSLNPFVKENTVDNNFDSFKKKYEKLEEQKAIEDAKKLQTGNSKDSNNLLPPNFAEDGKKEITTTPNGTVILGTSVADTNTSCGKDNVTKAELLNSLLKNRVIR